MAAISTWRGCSFLTSMRCTESPGETREGIEAKVWGDVGQTEAAAQSLEVDHESTGLRGWSDPKRSLICVQRQRSMTLQGDWLPYTALLWLLQALGGVMWE